LAISSEVARRSPSHPIFKEEPIRTRTAADRSSPARAPVERVHERGHEKKRKARQGKTRRKSKKRRGSRPRAAAKESHAYAQGNATPRKAGERTCSSRSRDRERGGIGDQRESCLDVGRPVGGDRHRRQSVTVRRCGFGENDATYVDDR
jgi:hypothetical protein